MDLYFTNIIANIAQKILKAERTTITTIQSARYHKVKVKYDYSTTAYFV